MQAECVIPNCRNRAPDHEAFCSAHRSDREPAPDTITIPRADLEAIRDALEQGISLLRATDQLKANGFADDTVNLNRAVLTKLEGYLNAKS